MEKARKREEVALEEQWDLSDLYASDEDYEKALDQLLERGRNFKTSYEGKLRTAELANQAIKESWELAELASRMAHYAGLSFEVDMTNRSLQQRAMDCEQKLAQLEADMAFLETELAALSSDELKKIQDLSEENRHFIHDIQRMKAHLLLPETEAALKKMGPVLRAPLTIYRDIKFSDIHFPSFEVEGREYEMTYSGFENTLEESSDTALRRRASQVFYDELDRHKHGTASAYNTEVQRDKIEADLRGYASVFDMMLDKQEVTRDLYDRQIDVIMDRLAPAMRQYAKLLGHIHGLDRMTTYDLKIGVDPDFEPKVSYKEAESYILEGLSILGDDYQSMLKAAFEDRWIDYAENIGKSTGAFTASPYGVHSYILSSFNRQMNEVFTLAHELGHAGAFYLSSQRNNIYDCEPTMYFIEAPSTTNEIIMENYMLRKAGEDKRERRWVLSQMVAHTYYHNFVTHLLEAAYQREVYRRADKGESFQAEELTAIYRQVLETFWGDAVEVEEGSALTWMRQPHYYDGLYSYTYSAGLTVGTEVARQIMEEGQAAADRWLEVLRMGGRKNPVELAAMAGVDITTSAPLEKTIDYIASLIDEMIDLTRELEK